MKKTRLLAMTVGAVLLAAIVIPAASWQWHVGGAAAGEGTADIRKLAGTLSIEPSLIILPGNMRTVYRRRYWIYVDGHIVDNKQFPHVDIELVFSITSQIRVSGEITNIHLVPGEYFVEVAREDWVFDESMENILMTFPFYFRSEKVHIYAGTTTRLPVLLNITQTEASRRQLVDNELIGTTFTEKTERLIERFERTTSKYQGDLALRAINGVYTAFQRSPPLRSVVFIDLPEEYGGGREFDAEQVRTLIHWIARKYWSWLSHAYIPIEDWPGEFHRIIDDMYDKVRKSWEPLLEVADKLDRAGK